MDQYLYLLKDVLENGEQKGDRTGTGTLSVFGRQLRFDLEEGFPLVTTKKIHFKSVVHELLWFISGETNIKYLQDNGVKIWDAWADENGELGPVYGKQWRSWNAPVDKGDGWGIQQIDQLGFVIRDLAVNPTSRQLVVTAWNPADVNDSALPPCHYAYQFYVNNGKLSCLCIMRSVDCFLGLPFDIASYALLLTMVAQITGLVPHELVFQLGDTHIYNNHLEQVKTQLKRVPRLSPLVYLNPGIKGIDDFKYTDVGLLGYDPHPSIKGKVAV